MSKFQDDFSMAAHPGMVKLCRQSFYRLEPQAQGVRGWIWLRFGEGSDFEELLARHLWEGDSRAACVMSLDPLLVAAHTREIDCVAMLHFPDWLVKEHGLAVGTRLLTVNTYTIGNWIASDLIAGPNCGQQFVNFHPVIAEFCSRDQERICTRKLRITEDEWNRCEDLGRDYLERFPGRWRNGSPWQSGNSATTPATPRQSEPKFEGWEP